MLLQLLQTMQTDLVNPDKIIDLSSRVSETSGGYTFAVSLLMFVILILLVVVRSLWKKMTEQDNSKKQQRIEELDRRLNTQLDKLKKKLDENCITEKKLLFLQL